MLKDSSKLNFFRCRIELNIASSIAGAIVASDNIILNISQTNLTLNTASRVSVLFGFNDDNSAQYLLTDNTIVAQTGLAVALLGNISDNFGNIVNSSWFGTVYMEDSTSEYFSASFSVCGKGTFSLDGGSSVYGSRQEVFFQCKNKSQMMLQCQPCVFGAKWYFSSQYFRNLSIQRLTPNVSFQQWRQQHIRWGDSISPTHSFCFTPASFLLCADSGGQSPPTEACCRNFMFVRMVSLFFFFRHSKSETLRFLLQHDGRMSSRLLPRYPPCQ